MSLDRPHTIYRITDRVSGDTGTTQDAATAAKYAERTDYRVTAETGAILL